MKAVIICLGISRDSLCVDQQEFSRESILRSLPGLHLGQTSGLKALDRQQRQPQHRQGTPKLGLPRLPHGPLGGLG